MAVQVGLFNDDSLYSKSLANTLTAEQFAHYDAIARERRENRHRIKIEMIVHHLEQQGAPLRDEQRQKRIGE